MLRDFRLAHPFVVAGQFGERLCSCNSRSLSATFPGRVKGTRARLSESIFSKTEPRGSSHAILIYLVHDGGGVFSALESTRDVSWNVPEQNTLGDQRVNILA